jgi:hypothetical protein
MEGVTQFSRGIEFNYRKIEIQEQEYGFGREKVWYYELTRLGI